ncbi:MAG: pentapeptide repeat-containing protein, partial [candidate division Zixibacteria bacterium]|nr:pentapeptide repeat-containing protein [candidate division Zixibacteria bacterium]
MTQTGRSDKSKTRWKPKREDIFHILREHKNWLDSDGKDGYQAEIYHADLSGADLYKANLRGAQIWDTYLYDADLREADLSQAEGIKPEHLAGADLSGAILPENLKHFHALDDVKKHSKKAHKIFIATLLILHFCWIMLLGLSDADLLSRIHLLPSLMPELSMPSFWFFTIFPIILFGLYIAFHLNIQRNWEKIAELPTIYPDETPIDKKIYQW